MLKDSKTKCDLLIVGLHSDSTLDRPEKQTYFKFTRKINIFQSIKYIDYIVIYERESDVSEILDSLSPNIRILGSDYINKEFTGKNKNIEIYYHDRFIHTYSTSNLRKRIYNIERLKHP